MGRAPIRPLEWGSISTKRAPSGTYYARVRVRDRRGVVKQLQAAGRSKSAAERELRDRLASWRGQTRRDVSADWMLADLAKEWLATVEASSLAINTKRRYAEVVGTAERGYVIRELGSLRIRECSTGVLQDWTTELHDRTGRETAKLARTVLLGILQVAVANDALERNPVREVTIPRAAERKAVQALSDEDVTRVLASFKADGRASAADLPTITEFMIGTGARIGEVLALRWDDVDLGATTPTVTIRATIANAKGSGWQIQDHPKSSTSNRVLMLPRFLVERLLERQVDGQWPSEVGLVFPSATGGVRDPSNLRRVWRDTLKGIGLAGVTPHTFRRTVATRIARALDVDAAAQQLGHSNRAVTVKHYIERALEAPDARAVLDVLAAVESAGEA